MGADLFENLITAPVFVGRKCQRNVKRWETSKTVECSDIRVALVEVVLGDMKRRLSLLVISIPLVYVLYPIAALARVGEAVTVRGILTRGGKAGNLWTLVLDQPFQGYDARELDRTQKAVLLRDLSFVGGREGPQDPSLAGKHVELSGNLLLPFGPGRTGVMVKTITVLNDVPKTDISQLQRQLAEIQKSYPGPPQYVIHFTDWVPLPLSLDKLETVDGIAIGSCSEARMQLPSGQAEKQCSAKAEKGISASEAARVLLQWVVVPKDFWFNNFSHTGWPDYHRVLKLRQTGGKDFVLDLEPYGTGTVIFEDGGGAYLVSPCNAAGMKPRSNEKSKPVPPCGSAR